MLSRIYIAIALPALITSMVLAGQQIVVSDGPNGTSSSEHPSIVTTDGPAVLPYAYPPKIITTNGPATLAYQYPPKLATTDGPNLSPNNDSLNSRALVVSDGPGTGRSLVRDTQRAQQTQQVIILDAPESIQPPKHTSKKSIAEHKPALPEPEASALAPAIPAQSPTNTMPPASHPSVSTLPEPHRTDPFPLKGIILASIVALSILAYGSLLLYRRWISPE